MEYPQPKAKLFGASKSTIYNYENGTTPPSAEYLEGLAQEGASADYLLRGREPVLRVHENRKARGYDAIRRVVEAIEMLDEVPVINIGNPLLDEDDEEADPAA